MDQLAVVPAYGHPELAVNECAYSQVRRPGQPEFRLSNREQRSLPGWLGRRLTTWTRQRTRSTMCIHRRPA